VEIGGRSIGNYGDISMMSFHATKLYHTIEGGALMHNDANLKRRIDFLKNFGIKDEDTVVMPGINGKMNELQAAIGLLNLENVEEERQKRKTLIAVYREELSAVEGIRLPAVLENVKANSQYFVIRINEAIFGKSRDAVYDEFKKYNVFVRKYFHPLCSDYTCYRQLASSNPKNLPNAVRIAREVLSMPLYGELTEADVRKICAILKAMKK
jgi:dTDP-4-amino-4,6-dideoxygalactose transaminase